MEELKDKGKLSSWKIKQKNKEMKNKKDIKRKSQDQFRRSNLPLMGVSQKENRYNKREKNLQRNNARKWFGTEKIKN